MTNWREVKLGELISIKHGYAFKGNDITTEDNGIVLVTPGNFAIGGGFQEEKCKFFKGQYPKDYVLKENDLIVTMTDLSKECDTLGYSALVPSGSRIYLHNQRIGLVEFKNNLVDKLFLYWFMRTKKYQHFVVSSCSGSVIKHTSPGRICDATISLPPLDIQKKIAGVLGALDDKIELNNKINNNLEQQAQALFKSWFVDFEPFGGKMPDDWKVGKLGDFIEIKRGGSPRPIQEYLVPNGLNWLKISDATAETSPYILEIKEHIKPEGLNKTVFLKKGSLVLSNSATPGIPKFLDIDTCIHDGWLYFPNSLFSNEYLFLLFNHIRKDLISLGNGSVFTNLKTDILKNFEAILPTKEVLRRFDSIISSIFISIKYNREEIATLTTLRDMLLPKLMSGEIDVSNVDISALTSADKLSFNKS